MLYVIVCGEQEKLGRNIYENAFLITSPTATTVSIVENPAASTANGHKLDPETITEVHLTQANLLQIAAEPIVHITGNLNATVPNHPKANMVNIVIAHQKQANHLNIGNLPTLGQVKSIIEDQADRHQMQDE